MPEELRKLLTDEGGVCDLDTFVGWFNAADEAQWQQEIAAFVEETYKDKETTMMQRKLFTAQFRNSYKAALEIQRAKASKAQGGTAGSVFKRRLHSGAHRARDLRARQSLARRRPAL